jgi:hypothetical protein
VRAVQGAREAAGFNQGANSFQTNPNKSKQIGLDSLGFVRPNRDLSKGYGRKNKKTDPRLKLYAKRLKRIPNSFSTRRRAAPRSLDSSEWEIIGAYISSDSDFRNRFFTMDSHCKGLRVGPSIRPRHARGSKHNHLLCRRPLQAESGRCPNGEKRRDSGRSRVVRKVRCIPGGLLANRVL